MNDFHNLLARQLKKHRFAADGPAGDLDFLRAVDAAYRQADTERALLERSLDLTSQELLRDLEDLGRAKEALSESQGFLERAQEAAKIGSWSSSLEGDGTLFFSRECLRILGVDVGKPFVFEDYLTLVHHDDRESLRRARAAAIRDGASFSHEYRIKRADGALRWVHSRADVIRDANGVPQKLIGIIQDITEHRELKERLSQSEKMEAVGRLAGGIAHDFNNILTAIKGYSSFLKLAVAKDAALCQDVEEIEKAAERATALTRQLLAFSRKQVLRPEVLDLNAVVSGLENMMRLLIRADIELVTALQPGLGRIKADPGQISQVVMNLIVNGRDAMPDGGRLLIETADVPAGGGPLALPAVRISVVDEGVGMDEAVLARVFEPFYTTKEQGKGTGLGLSTVYGIVSQSGGHIAAESVPGRGTRFNIHLPRLESGELPAPGPAPAPVERDTHGSETVLVVEDEAGVREMMSRTLRERGYEVLAASGGAEALRAVEAHHGEIRAVITDIIMPGMNGSILADRIRPLRPGIRVLYMSGYTDDVIGRHGVLEPGIPFLQKPFTPRVLAERLRELLACAPA